MKSEKLKVKGERLKVKSEKKRVLGSRTMHRAKGSSQKEDDRDQRSGFRENKVKSKR